MLVAHQLLPVLPLLAHRLLPVLPLVVLLVAHLLLLLAAVPAVLEAWVVGALLPTPCCVLALVESPLQKTHSG